MWRTTAVESAIVTLDIVIFLVWIGCLNGVLVVIIFMKHFRLYRALYCLILFDTMRELPVVLRGELGPF